MPQRRSLKRNKRNSRRRSSQMKKKNQGGDGSLRVSVHYHQHRPFQNYSSVSEPKLQPRPHHYEYRSGDIHEHLNRVNYAPSHKLTQHDEIQRQLKQNADKYVPNYMHVSSNELAIPAPLKHMQRGMRMFTSA